MIARRLVVAVAALAIAAPTAAGHGRHHHRHHDKKKPVSVQLLALEHHLQASLTTPIAPPATDRITKNPSRLLPGVRRRVAAAHPVGDNRGPSDVG